MRVHLIKKDSSDKYGVFALEIFDLDCVSGLGTQGVYNFCFPLIGKFPSENKGLTQ